MIVGLNGRWVIPHVPKTGGTWLRVVLCNQMRVAAWDQGEHRPHRPPRLDSYGGTPSHRTPHAGRWPLPQWMGTYPVADDVHVLTFVRNPFDWYWSMFWMSRADKWRAHGGRWPFHRVADRYGTEPRFGQFVDWMAEHEPAYLSRLYRAFVGTRTDRVAINASRSASFVVARYEEGIEGCVRAWLPVVGLGGPEHAEILGKLSGTLGPVNVYGKRTLIARRREATFTESMRAVIFESEGEAFHEFGYNYATHAAAV